MAEPHFHHRSPDAHRLNGSYINRWISIQVYGCTGCDCVTPAMPNGSDINHVTGFEWMTPRTALHREAVHASLFED